MIIELQRMLRIDSAPSELAVLIREEMPAPEPVVKETYPLRNPKSYAEVLLVSYSDLKWVLEH